MRPTETRAGTASSNVRATFAGRCNQSQVRSQGVRRAQWNHSQRDVGPNQALHNLVHCAVTAACQNRVKAHANGLLLRGPLRCRERQFRTPPQQRPLHGARPLISLNGRFPPRGVLAGSRVVDQRHTAHCGFHLDGGSCLFKVPSGTSCYHRRFEEKNADRLLEMTRNMYRLGLRPGRWARKSVSPCSDRSSGKM